MDEIIRRTQEEEVLLILEREGFRELSANEVQNEPDKSLYALPECFQNPHSHELRRHYQNGHHVTKNETSASQ